MVEDLLELVYIEIPVLLLTRDTILSFSLSELSSHMRFLWLRLGMDIRDLLGFSGLVSASSESLSSVSDSFDSS